MGSVTTSRPQSSLPPSYRSFWPSDRLEDTSDDKYARACSDDRPALAGGSVVRVAKTHPVLPQTPSEATPSTPLSMECRLLTPARMLSTPSRASQLPLILRQTTEKLL